MLTNSPVLFLLTSYIFLLARLGEQIVIQLNDAVAEGEALRLYCFAYFAHDIDG